MKEAGIVDTVQNTEFPVIVRRMKDENGKTVWFYFNYSHTPAEAVYTGADGVYLMKEDQTFRESMWQPVRNLHLAAGMYRSSVRNK